MKSKTFVGIVLTICLLTGSTSCMGWQSTPSEIIPPSTSTMPMPTQTFDKPPMAATRPVGEAAAYQRRLSDHPLRASCEPPRLSAPPHPLGTQRKQENTIISLLNGC